MSKVIIGCKLPSGMMLENGMRGSAGYSSVTLKGANEGEIRDGGLFVPHTVGGFGKTEVDAAFWNAWKTGEGIVGVENRDRRTGTVLMTAKDNQSALVRARRELVEEWQEKGLVFEVADSNLALAQANEKAAVKSGFEPLAQSGDPRAPKQVVKAA